jgi:ATP synthase protein I
MQEEAAESHTREGTTPQWTAEQAAYWRLRHPDISLWLTVLAQIVVLVAVIVGATLASVRREITVSLLWGGLAAVMPAVLSVAGYRTTMRLLAGRRRSVRMVWGLMSIVFWEVVKLVSSVGLLVLAPRWLSQVHWLSVVLMFVAVIKAYWLVVLLDRRRNRRVDAAVLKQMLENGV